MRAIYFLVDLFCGVIERALFMDWSDDADRDEG